MASSDNVTNEKPSDFADGAYDPDLEARLYAEIYYSNETYVPDSESLIPNDTVTPNFAPNVATSLSSTKSLVSNGIATEANPVPLNKENQLPTDNLLEDFRSNDDINDRQNSDIGKLYYPTENWVFGEVHGIIHGGVEHQSIRTKVVRRQRLLAHKDLWLTPENTEENRSIVRQPNVTPTRTETPTVVVAQLSTNQANCVIRYDSSCTQDEPVSTTKATTSKRKRQNLKQIVKKQVRARKALRRYNDALNNVAVTMETSKYKVVSKKKKLKMKQINPDPVDISSDSDDSILEVPVPPKAPPVIIQLPDSDDDYDKTTNASSTKTKKSGVARNNESVLCCNLETDSSMSNESSEPPTRETNPSNADEISNEARNNARNTADVFVEPTCSGEDILVLNCTEIQRGASSLSEIRKMRETGLSIHAHSDDSMTESEANNWVNIAAGQSDATRDEEICLIELSNDTVNTKLWNQMRDENPAAAGLPTEMPSTSGGASSVTTVTTIEKYSNISVINEEVATGRKRQKVVSSPFTDFDVPAIPEKRSKRSKHKSNANQSLTEYFFKPMSKELQAVYNNPWGGENMNLYDIQSRMPENPRCWTILDADLRGPTSKRRRACPRCKTNSHFGKRCPEKAKEPCCYMCGAKGHTESRCPHTMCLTCGRKYATYRPTCGYCSKLHCNMCNGSGHSSNNCPDLWRRYHNTTTETIPIVPRDASNIMKAPQYLTCCNCAKRGHDVTMCRQLRWSQHFPTPMSVSSYTEGPFYELLHCEQIRDASPSEDLIHESPRHEEIDDPNPSTDLMYVPPHHERIQDTTPAKNIVILEDHHGRNASIAEPSSSVSLSNVIFQTGDFGLPEMIIWHRISKRLDIMKNVHLGGLLTGNLKPTFLRTWQKSFEFSVRISDDPDRVTHMVIEAKSSVLLKGLEKLMMQWLMRTDDEKPNLKYDILPYDNIDIMMEHTRSEMRLLNKVLEPTVLLKKIVACEDSLRHIRAKYSRRATSMKKSRKRLSLIEGQINIIMKRRCQLVTSLYSRSLVEGGDAIVRSFRQLVRLIKPKKQLPIHHYLELIYLNNEIFTFHTTEALSKALDKAILVSKQSELTTTRIPEQSPPVDTSGAMLSGSQIEPIDIINVCERNSTGHLTDLPMIDNNSLSIYCSPLTPQHAEQMTVIEDCSAESSQIPTTFGTIDAQNMIYSNTNDGTDINFHKEWNSPFTPVPVNGFNSQNTVLSPTINRRRLIGRGGRKNIDRNEGLLRNLTKQNRKLYRSLAKEVIKLANSSNIPHLQEMAKVLKVKAGNGSITTNDVHTLQRVLESKLRQKIKVKNQSRRHRNSLRNNSNRAYQDFLRTL